MSDDSDQLSKQNTLKQVLTTFILDYKFTSVKTNFLRLKEHVSMQLRCLEIGIEIDVNVA